MGDTVILLWSMRIPVFEYTGNVTWIKGNHNIRFGLDVSQQHMNHKEVGPTQLQIHRRLTGLYCPSGSTYLRLRQRKSQHGRIQFLCRLSSRPAAELAEQRANGRLGYAAHLAVCSLYFRHVAGESQTNPICRNGLGLFPGSLSRESWDRVL